MKLRNLPVLILALVFAAAWWPPALVHAAEPIAPDWVAACPANTVPVEGQAWWHPKFGHVHIGGCAPYNHTLTGDYTATIHVVMHDNPGVLSTVGIMLGDPHMTGFVDNEYEVTPGHTCPSPGTCHWSFTITAPTAAYPFDGWNTLRFISRVVEPDGRTLLASLHIPVRYANGNPVQDWGGATQAGSHQFLAGRSWYAMLGAPGNNPHAGYVVPNVFNVRTAGQTVNTSFVYRFESKNIDGRKVVLTTIKRDATHDNPGTVLYNRANVTVPPTNLTINTAALANGWHSILLRTESRGFEGNNTVGVTKYWFRVQH